MQIRVATRHGHLSESSQEAVKERAEKLTRYFDRLTSIELVIDLKDSTNPKVDLKVSAEHKHDFVAHNQSENLMGSVDAVVQKLEQQLRRYKEKVQARNRNSESKRSEPHDKNEGGKNEGGRNEGGEGLVGYEETNSG